MDLSDDMRDTTHSHTETFNNHSIELLQQLNIQRTNSLFCDVVVRVGRSVEFSAHRCVLAAASSVFHTLVCTTSETKDDVSTLIILDTLNAAGFESIIEYIYTGLLQLTTDNVFDVLAVATYVQLTDVINTCLSFISIHVKVDDIGNKEKDKRNSTTQHRLSSAAVTLTDAASSSCSTTQHRLSSAAVTLTDAASSSWSTTQHRLSSAAVTLTDAASSSWSTTSHDNNMTLSTNVATPSVGRYSLRSRRRSTLDHQPRDTNHATRSALQPSANNNNNNSSASTTGTSTSVTGSSTRTTTSTTTTAAAAAGVYWPLKRHGSTIVSQDMSNILKQELHPCQLSSAVHATASEPEGNDNDDYYTKHETISADDTTDLTRLSVCTELDSFVLDAYTGIQMDGLTNHQPIHDRNVSIHDRNLTNLGELQVHSNMEDVTDRHLDSDDCFVCQNSSDFSSGGKFGMLDGASSDGGICLKSQLKKRLKMKCGSHGSGGSDLQPCPTCGRKFTLASVLTRHMRQHSTKTYTCALCDAIFLDPTTLKRHSVLLHKERNAFVCPHDGCKFRSDRLSNVEKHVMIHSTNHSFSCSRCGRTFAQENGLQSHLQSCLELRSFLCDLCGKAFNHLQSMRSHRRIHTSEKPYKCAQCNAQFTDHRNYKRHRRIHDNTFPYACVICDKCFRHSNSLKSHLASHSILPNVDAKVNPPLNISLS